MAAKLSLTAAVLVLCGSWLMIANSVEAAPQVLVQGYKLSANSDLHSLKEGPFQFTMQDDCNLVLYKDDKPIWASNTGGSGHHCEFKMERDGNAVIYENRGNRIIWKTDTNGMGGIYIILQCDGNVVMYNEKGRPVWATDTGGKEEAIDLEEGNRLRKPSLDSVVLKISRKRM